MTLRSVLTLLAAAVLCGIFVCTGYLFVRQAGVQEDEVLFTSALFEPQWTPYSWEIAGNRVPVMLLPYLGALKTWLYKPIFGIWPADVRSLRVPALLVAGLAVFLFFLAFWWTLGAPRALIATALLAVDPLFLLTSVYDWGPVCLQHFLAAAALLCLLVFHRREHYRFLALGSFFCGLALWDKLTFVWILLAAAAGALAAFRRELRRHMDFRLAAFVMLWMCLGALPLIIYNVQTGGGSWSGSGGLSAPPVRRLAVLSSTLKGRVMFEWLVRNRGTGEPREPQTNAERFVAKVSRILGEPDSHGLLWASIASAVLLCFPICRQSRPAMVFCVVGMAAGWLGMLAFSKGAGGAHHLVLLWPLPQVLVACSIWELGQLVPRQRAVASAAAAALLVVSIGAVTAEYYSRLVRWGPSAYWSDAVHDLRTVLSNTASSGILPLDWGIFGPLRFLGRGRLPLRFTSDWLDSDRPTAAQRAEVLALLDSGHFHFIAYSSRFGVPPEKPARMRSLADEHGYREETLAEIPDRNGRPVYRIYRFVRAAGK